MINVGIYNEGIVIGHNCPLCGGYQSHGLYTAEDQEYEPRHRIHNCTYCHGFYAVSIMLHRNGKVNAEIGKIERIHHGSYNYPIAHCPYCGSAKTEVESSRSTSFVTCTMCDARGPVKELITEAIIAWNIVKKEDDD